MKLKNKKTLIAIVALFLVIGVTIAYFSSTASFENIFNTGTYKVVSTEVFESPDNWVPGEEIPKTITTTNEGTIPAAVRVSYTEKWEDENGTDITSTIDSGTAIINYDNQEDWTKQGDYYYYNYILNPGETTSSFIKSVTLNPALNDVTCTTSADGKTKTCETNNPAAGAKYTLTITKETVQADKYQEVWPTAPEITERQVAPAVVPNIGDVAYFDPVTNTTCDSTTYDPTSVNNGTSTCYKWNVISQQNNQTTLMLDHNIGSSQWDSAGSTSSGPRTILPALQTSTSTWTRVPLLDYEYDTTGRISDNYGTLTCESGSCHVKNDAAFVTNLRARIITAEELATAICETGVFEFETNRACSTFTLHGVNPVEEGGEIYGHNLFLYDDDYTSYQDSIAWLNQNVQSSSAHNYATLSPAGYDSIWYDSYGYMFDNEYSLADNTSGIRPVITISTSDASFAE